MTATLSIEIETRPFERVQADIAVAGVFEDDRPLRGSAARADWRLCGLISHLVESDRITGRVGEALLMPSGGRMRTSRVLVLGLGQRAKRSGLQVQDLVRDALTRVRGLGLRDVALAPLGFAGDEWSLRGQAVIDGALEAHAGSPDPILLRFVVPGEGEARARASIGAALDALGDPRVQLARRDGRDSTAPAARPRRSPQGQPGSYRTP